MVIMNTIYGEMHDQFWINYFKSLVGRTYKILPMYEKNVVTLNSYIESFLRELTGNQELAEKIRHDANFISLCGTLQNLLSEQDTTIFKSDIFKCINLIKKIQSSIGGQS